MGDNQEYLKSPTQGRRSPAAAGAPLGCRRSCHAAEGLSHPGPGLLEISPEAGVSMRETLEAVMLLAWKEEAGAMSQKCRWLLEAGKGKDIGASLEAPKGTQPCLDF